MSNSAFTVTGSSSGNGAIVKVSQQIASNSVSIQFVGLSSAYSSYQIIATNIIMSVNGSNLDMTMNADGSGVYDYSWWFSANNNTSGIGSFGSNATSLDLISFLSSSLPAALTLNIYNPSASAYCSAYWLGNYINGAGVFANLNGGGFHAANVPVTSVEFLPSSGVITSGIFTLYGIL